MSAEHRYKHLGQYSDWVSAAMQQLEIYPTPSSDEEVQKNLRNVLGFNKASEMPIDVKIERQWEKDGILGEEISWWVGYGPRTFCWLLRPKEIEPPLPGIIALHDHGGFKYYGKEKIAEGPESPSPEQIAWWQSAYGGRPYANFLAKSGYAVLVPDTFLWGSRRFLLEDIPESVRFQGSAVAAQNQIEGQESEIAKYNVITSLHEHVIEKYCNLLGTTLAGVVSHEDRMALNYFASRKDIVSNRLACLGLSGGGNRSCLLLATSNKVNAAAIIGLMSTYADLLDHNVVTHTWMFFPSGWSRYGDWPDIASCRAPMPLFIQYDLEDELFTPTGMQNAHQKILSHYKMKGNPDAYKGGFYPGPHKFDLVMQNDVVKWLYEVL